jgi:hypothetical protein
METSILFKVSLLVSVQLITLVLSIFFFFYAREYKMGKLPKILAGGFGATSLASMVVTIMGALIISSINRNNCNSAGKREETNRIECCCQKNMCKQNSAEKCKLADTTAVRCCEK